MPWGLTDPSERAAARTAFEGAAPIVDAGADQAVLLDELVGPGLTGNAQRYAVGETIHNAPGELWMLAEGVVALRSVDHFHRIVRGPNPLSPAYFGYDAPDILVLSPGAILGKLTSGVVGPVFNHNDVFNESAIEASGEDLAHIRDARQRLYAGMTDHFEDDGAVSPGPYASSAVRMCMLLVEDPSPPPLPWNVAPALPGSKRYFIVLTDYSNFSGPSLASSYDYRELAYLLPVLTTTGAGFHSVRLFPDGVMPTAVGRELYAFPKTFGQVWQDHQGGGAAEGGNLHLHAEWTDLGPIPLSDAVRQMTDALLPSFPLNPVSWMTGQVTKLFEPLLTSWGLPMRIYTERDAADTPGSPLGHAEMVRAPFRFVLGSARELRIDGLYHATKPGLKALGAWDLTVDMRLDESYAVHDRSNWLRTPLLRLQVPFRMLLEFLP